MNKIKQNKITFTLILVSIVIIFSSLAILSLPVLFNYKSKVTIIENNFYKNFKIYLNSSGKISYKAFPKPHLLVENATLNLSKSQKKSNFLDTKNLKIFISLKDIYLRSFKNLVSTEISNSNLELKMQDIKKIRMHLYQNINKPIFFTNCKVFLRNNKNEVFIISPVKKISYKINNKSKIKQFIINGEVFGLNYKSEWKRDYTKPKKSLHNIDIIYPNIEIKNILEFDNANKFEGQSQIIYGQDKLEYNFQFNNQKIKISSPNNEKTNFDINSNIQLSPFYFTGSLIIKNKKIEKIIDNFLLNLILYNENYLGNLNGLFDIKFDGLKNRLIKKGEIKLIIKEKKITIKKAKFLINKIGYINSIISFEEDKDEIKFISTNQLIIENHIEFAKIFQIGSKKIKNIKQIHFDLEKQYGQTDFIIKNVKINDGERNLKSKDIFLIKNIQNLRSHIRKVIN